MQPVQKTTFRNNTFGLQAMYIHLDCVPSFLSVIKANIRPIPSNTGSPDELQSPASSST